MLRLGVIFEFLVGVEKFKKFVSFISFVPNNSFMFCVYDNFSFDSSTSTLAIFDTPI